jgi:phage baseplate assembly protein W
MGRNMTVIVPHFRFPFGLDGASFGVNEQDTHDEIQDCVAVLISTPTGSRMVQPDYGVDEALFQQVPVDMTSIVTALTQWEPRAVITLTQTLSTVDEKILHIRARVTGGSQ